MEPEVKAALTWVLLGLAVVMTGFTALDLASGTRSTALWISAGAWPVTAITAFFLTKNGPR